MNKKWTDEDYKEFRREAEAKEKAAKEEYEIKMADLLKEIPTEFHSFVRSYSWQEGHAYGYHEVYGKASDLVENLKPSIEAYRLALEKSFDTQLELG